MDLKYIRQIAESLRKYCGGHPDKATENSLVEIAASTVRGKLRDQINAAAFKQGTDWRQQSVSIVAGLFSADGKKRLCAGLSDYLDSDDITLCSKFQSIAVNCARQELFHRWEETDSLSPKLHRNLNRILAGGIR